MKISYEIEVSASEIVDMMEALPELAKKFISVAVEIKREKAKLNKKSEKSDS